MGERTGEIDGEGEERPAPYRSEHYGWEDVPEPLRWLLTGLALALVALALLTWIGEPVDRLGRNSVVGPALAAPRTAPSSTSAPP